jgi:hypothetical protein
MISICSLSCQCVLPSNSASASVTTRTADILSPQMPRRRDPARMPTISGKLSQSTSIGSPFRPVPDSQICARK